MNKKLLILFLALVGITKEASAITWKFGSFHSTYKTCKLTGWGGNQPASGKLTIPSTYKHTDGVTYTVNNIASNALNDLTEVTEITIPASVTYIGSADFSDNLMARTNGVDNFNNCPNLSKIKVESANPRFGSTGAGLLVSKDLGKLFKVPADVNVEGGILTLSSKTQIVTDGCFKDCWSINTIGFPAGILEISPDAGFEEMEQLSGFTVAGSQSSYGVADGALIHTGRKELIAYPRVRTIQNLEISYPIEKIGDKAFANSKYLKSVKLPASLERIGERAFRNSSVTSVVIPSGVKYIETEAFSRSKLTEVALPDTWISDGAYDDIFAGCTALRKITLKSKKTLLSDGFARDCTSLTKVVAENTISSVYSAAFKNCTSLTEFPFSADTKMYFDSTFVNTGFTEVKFKDGAACDDALESNMFMYCKNLKKIDLSAIDTESEGRGSLLIPAYFVSNCPQLKEIRFPKTTYFGSVADDGAFCNIGPNVPLEKIVIGSFDIYVNNHAVRIYGPGNFSPVVYLKTTMDGNASYYAPLAQMFETANGATVSPVFYCEAFRSPKTDYVVNNATYYVAGRCSFNYEKAIDKGARVLEMFDINLSTSLEKKCAVVKVTPLGAGPVITRVTFNGKVAVKPDAGGNAYSGLSRSEIKDILVEYTVNGEKMKTLYPAEALGSSAVEEIGESLSTLRISVKGKSVEIYGGDGTPSCSVYSLGGMQVACGEGNILDLTGIASGIYIIKASDANGSLIEKIHIR